MRRPFGTALTYFQLVQQRAAGLTHNVIENARPSPTPTSDLPDLTTEHVEELSRTANATSYFASEESCLPVNDEAPSLYLQSRCFLCHPAKPSRASEDSFHGIYCLDACFQQVRLRGAGGSDPELDSPRTYFLSAEDVAKARWHVEKRRKAKPDDSRDVENLDVEDRVEPGLEIPTSVLDDCEKSFKAADENRQKGATSSFADTGLMALICMHDRVLHLVNVTSAGEKQYYAVALLTALFKGLPSWWKAGILYDIACQLHRSTLKVRTTSSSYFLPSIKGLMILWTTRTVVSPHERFL